MLGKYKNIGILDWKKVSVTVLISVELSIKKIMKIMDICFLTQHMFFLF